MGLLHYNSRGITTKILFAGVASIVAAGFFGASSAGALGITAFLQESNPISARIKGTEVDEAFLEGDSPCEDIDPESMISCNINSSTLLYNKIADGEKLWGHEGKGNIFINTDNLIDGDAQLRAAERGETVDFSMIIEPERYYDEAETKPILKYALLGLGSPGLTLDESSFVVKVGGQILPAEEYDIEVENLSEEEIGQSSEATILQYASMFTITLDWSNYTRDSEYNDANVTFDSFKYADGASIEVLYSATVSESAASEVSMRAVYEPFYLNGTRQVEDYSGLITITTDPNKAIVVVDAAIMISRVDASGEPVPGAKYAIDGISAMPSEAGDGYYTFAPEGEIAEFTTNSNGEIYILGVPIGEYTVRELAAPNNSISDEPVKTVNLAKGVHSEEYGEDRLILNYLMGKYDFTDLIGKRTLDDDRTLVTIEEMGLSRIWGGGSEFVLNYNSATRTYTGGGLNVKKVNDQYVLSLTDSTFNFTYDDALGKQAAVVDFIGHQGYDSVRQNFYVEETADGINIKSGMSNYDLEYNQETGCYEGYETTSPNVASLEPAQLCKNGDHYYMIDPIDTGTVWFGTYYYDAASGKYLRNFDQNVYAIESVSDSEMVVSMYSLVFYSEDVDLYVTSMMRGVSAQAELVPEKGKTWARRIMFTEKSGEEAVPEDIINPQTGDEVMKAAIIAAVCTAPILGLRKRLRS